LCGFAFISDLLTAMTKLVVASNLIVTLLAMADLACAITILTLVSKIVIAFADCAGIWRQGLKGYRMNPRGSDAYWNKITKRAEEM